MKKISFILAMALVFAMLPTMAFAAGIQDYASSIRIGDSVTDYYEKIDGYTYSGPVVLYEINVNEKGTLTINANHENDLTYIALYDDNGKKLTAVSATATRGSVSGGSGNGQLSWNSTFEKAEGSFTYKVSSGTYYLECKKNTSWRSGGNGGDQITISTKFTSDSKPATTSNSNSTASTSGKTPTTYMAINLQKGQEIQLSAVLTNSSNNTTTWATKNSAIATVTTSGKVKAVAEGSTYISVTANGKTDYLYIRVSK